MPVLHFYRTPCLSDAARHELFQKTQYIAGFANNLLALRDEFCFNVDSKEELTDRDKEILTFLLRETFEPELFGDHSFLEKETEEDQKHGQVIRTVVEVGPRMNFTTAWSSNAVNICEQCGIHSITRIERSRRYLLLSTSQPPSQDVSAFVDLLHDRMTECRYLQPLTSFESGARPQKVFTVPLLEQGREALQKISQEMGLALDEQDLDYYTNLFTQEVGRNPTNVELFDIGQSNSEHSRHWFFSGKLVIDGQEMPQTLFQLVKEPWKVNPNNSTIAFADNSSAMAGFEMDTLHPALPDQPSPYTLDHVNYDLTLTAETHNFPSGVAPFPGAETGTGGRIRDGHATGTGSLVVAGTVGYCVGNLHIPGYELPWENKEFEYPSNLASPLQIEVEASNGASDYGNKFGEPVIVGFTRSFGQRLPNGERREWVKPIMFSGGVGQMDARHRKKNDPEVGMLVVKIGGPAYRIGMGGGAASSMVQGDNRADLDFNAVQRGDAEMEQKVNRVIRACVELGGDNPIVSIHDQGAGGAGNVLKEIAAPAGCRIEIRQMLIGDNTLSVLELWGAEYQENDALLLKPDHLALFQALCARESAPFAVVGVVTGDGRVVVHDSADDSTPVNLSLDHVLAKMPQKTFRLSRAPTTLAPLTLPQVSVSDVLGRVLRLLSVGSKRFLTSKVDRSVTGLIAQQQCVGPLHTPLADVAVIAQSHFSKTGCATAIGEQPIKGLLDCSAMARLAVAESLTNMVWAKITGLGDVKASGNWMWAAKLAGEGPLMYDAAQAICQIMTHIGMAIDGGKDSLSMAARCPRADGAEIVKAPGAIVISSYAPCPDITLTVTPDLKLGGGSTLVWIPLSQNARLGGSALAQCYEQIGDQCPDVDDVDLLIRAFNTVQGLIERRLVSAGHDVSDGGLLTAVLEMAFAGNCGLDLKWNSASVTDSSSLLAHLFAEELGLVMEISRANMAAVSDSLTQANVPFLTLGNSRADPQIAVTINDNEVLNADMRDLRDMWEETSFQLERLQRNPACVAQEQRGLRHRTGPRYELSYEAKATPIEWFRAPNKYRVAILRQEGSNGDREMASAFYSAGFEVWDVAMSDMLSGRIDSLDRFQGVAFVGGFANADVLDSGKGWSGSIRFNPQLTSIFQQFYARQDTFSLGVCNGCQLMALLGWVPYPGLADAIQPRFIHNESGRFESRFSTVRIEEGPCIFFRGMAGSVLGVWVSHGEGRAFFPDTDILSRARADKLVPLVYVNDAGEATQEYPLNPNGSPFAIGGLCSHDGRHFALMPHPERCFLPWQWPYQPPSVASLPVSPWLRMFQNAYAFCAGIQQF